MGDRTKIDWCDASWNPVTGCMHGCTYCYARRIARRFCSNEHGKDCVGPAYPCSGDCKFCSELDGPEFVGQVTRWNHSPKEPYPFGFLPTIHPHRLDIPSRWRKPRTIFVCSMADLFGKWVPDRWIAQVFEACKEAPQHRYLFLTKNGERYIELGEKGILEQRDNFWYGTTITTPDSPYWWSDRHHHFASVEPIMEPFDYKALPDEEDRLTVPEWMIVGAETGNRKGKAVPAKDWLDGILKGREQYGYAVFMKESLRELMGADFLQEFPWGGKDE